jgi:hypothetical protein
MFLFYRPPAGTNNSMGSDPTGELRVSCSCVTGSGPPFEIGKEMDMAFATSKHLAVGMKVRVAEPMDVPEWSKWDDDKGRTSSSIKKRLQSLFFQGSKKVVAEVVYVSRESEREMLRRKGQVKIRVRDQSGCMLSITADPTKLISN